MSFQEKIVHIPPEICTIFFHIIELEASSILESKIVTVGRCLLESMIGARKKELLVLGDVWKHWRSVGEGTFYANFYGWFFVGKWIFFYCLFFRQRKDKIFGENY